MGISAETISLSVACTHCGGHHIGVSRGARAGVDLAPVRCEDCGASLGVWSEVKEQARAAMFDALREDFKGLLESVSRRTPDYAAAA